MEIRCPHCSSPFELDSSAALRADGGTDHVLPDGLRGEQRHCGDCGRLFSVYVY